MLAKCVLIIILQLNRPFPNYLWPLFQSESWCSSFHMKISFHLHVNESLFSYEKMSTRTRFEKEAKGNSEMAYWCVRFEDRKKRQSAPIFPTTSKQVISRRGKYEVCEM